MPTVTQFPDDDVLSHYAAKQIVTGIAQAAVEQRGRFSSGFPAVAHRKDSTNCWRPNRTLRKCRGSKFISLGRRTSGATKCFRSNYRQVHDTILTHIAVPDSHIHRIKGELEPNAATNDYKRRLAALAEPGRMWPQLDVALLGMGSDGHTASLFRAVIRPMVPRSRCWQ